MRLELSDDQSVHHPLFLSSTPSPGYQQQQPKNNIVSEMIQSRQQNINLPVPYQTILCTISHHPPEHDMCVIEIYPGNILQSEIQEEYEIIPRLLFSENLSHDHLHEKGLGVL